MILKNIFRGRMALLHFQLALIMYGKFGITFITRKIIIVIKHSLMN